MIRREFCKASLGMAGLALTSRVALAGTSGQDAPAAAAPSAAGAPGLTHLVSEFVVNAKYADLPPEVLDLAKKSILDGFGLALAGSVSEHRHAVLAYVEAIGSSGQASVLGTGMKSAARFAAFANGVWIHADDFDDTQLAVAKDRVYGLLTHPTVPVLPPAFALCELGRRTGKDLLLAYNVAVEVECKIAEAISPRHYGDGFHSTGTSGSFGSAAACAKLRGLDAAQTAFALGIAAAEAGGLRENFGTMTKPFQAGHAAENGTVAADLAALGWTAAPNILEARFGWFSAAGGGYDPAAIWNRLGAPWAFVSPGVSIKPFPCGSLTHPAMWAFLNLVKEHDVKPEAVARIDLGGNSKMVSTLLHHDPRNALQAKFSMEFALAILLLERKAGLAQFQDAVVLRPDVREWIKRVNYYVDPEAEAAGFSRMTSIIRIHMKDGRVISGRADMAKGSPANPMSYRETADKFRECAEFAKWPRQKAETIVAAVEALEQAPDMDRLRTALTVQ
jgi:2-methylcitrate dehydratase PrpD